ncbi:ABC transporter substrate-binding protein [Variovorax ginsengisoli]|uniref:Branched-chain amino acid transport system substrate-binding protein n=1 Tax=Variovorax ginsengisoli TaxID=363844 RepID=A0ABT9S3Z5_9BURK|nr:ABC transporter substrate-binding protein [Variovorax ginsengisoli]MDP9898940.1 branched-chain amino acid transport system substrate-binding protein [Variovorax ginsengisoli]
MKPLNRTAIALGLALGLTAGLSAAASAADLKIGFISSLSGPVSALGIPYEKGIRAAIAENPSLAGHKVQLIVLDDASDPTTAGRNARKLVVEDKVDVLIGTSGVPGAMAIAAVAKELNVPLISPTPVTIPGGADTWTVTVSQSFPLMVSAVVERMQKAGVKTVAFIGFSDALGDLAYDSLKKSADAVGIKIVANERYARADASVTGQVLKIAALRPDAVFAGNSGTPGALPYLALAERGYKGQLYGTHGLINADFVRVGGTSIDGLQVPSGPVLVADQLPADNPIRAVSMNFRSAYQKANGAMPNDAFSSYTYDSYLLLGDAAKRAKGEPGTPAYRTALRDAIMSTKELVGTHGVYNFKVDDRYGSDKRAVVMVKMEKGQWKLAP